MEIRCAAWGLVQTGPWTVVEDDRVLLRGRCGWCRTELSELPVVIAESERMAKRTKSRAAQVGR